MGVSTQDVEVLQEIIRQQDLRLKSFDAGINEQNATINNLKHMLEILSTEKRQWAVDKGNQADMFQTQMGAMNAEKQTMGDEIVSLKTRLRKYEEVD